MNKLQVIVIALAAAAVGFLAAWWGLSGSDSGSQEGSGESGREILYWEAPMDPNYRRDEPGKSPMGMDLVPVYADEAGSGGDQGQPSIRINPTVINNIGVKLATVERRTLARDIDAVGLVTPDGGHIAHVHVRTEGWIEVLHVETEGERVSAGEPLFEIYSPALVSAQEEYLQAVRMGNQSLVTASKSRLASLGMREEQVRALQQRGSPNRLFTVHAPQDGHLLELNIRQGMFVQPGTTIMSVADLSRIWVEVDIFEGQVNRVEPGQQAVMQLPWAESGNEWRGEVDYVYPSIRQETRTGRVRLTFDNPDLTLKPNMYARVSIAADPHPDTLVVPTQSIIRTGQGERVILALGEGRFRPAEVVTGLESDGVTEITDGLAEGERIVVSSQFLIDSEASADASLLRMVDGEDASDSEMDHEMDHGTDQEMDHSAESGSAEAMDHEGHQNDADMDHTEMDHSGHDSHDEDDGESGGRP
ncbi:MULTISPECIES: efflux RND transporter periplasmic adaptor subunit [unclassified Wenzhouxiangella]|uniref:efflux RND transporter periplasmic adaptor subunit n=1 Tax=unclassified Wenzhouxiangella TaxID=2613841 RepID=UPI000E328045|nr:MULTISPECIES: efflux RND transporter periplasmic adaptor subunit [unclassified Wenzhouxiangella]RFF28021.1 efflux RND transporter periplasmic adaptor subunit [Wenzhouxiangella sp. 15181]RFP68607.1 efflux RND transporter periplasmic adaptor subunit [Wenzhouxiangella sp. 15190]